MVPMDEYGATTSSDETTPLTTYNSGDGVDDEARKARHSRSKFRLLALLLVLVLLLALVTISCPYNNNGSSARSRHDDDVSAAEDLETTAGEVPLLQAVAAKEAKEEEDDDDWIPNVNVANYSFPITIHHNLNNKHQDHHHHQSSKEIQRLFDVGLMECYGFAFQEAQNTVKNKLIPLLLKSSSKGGDCPMCFWLLSMTYSPFINHPKITSAEIYQKAKQAAQKAALSAQQSTKKTTTQTLQHKKESHLINAIQLRYSNPYENQTIGYQLYREALQQLHSQLPSDPDIMAFLADSIMILHSNDQGYQFYMPDNITPQPGIQQAITLLEKCLEITRQQHPYCQHLYIHITEPSRSPQRASNTADQLLANAKQTQAQHLQHMPSHTYLRMGRYHDATIANAIAHESDEMFLKHNSHHHMPYGPAHDTAFLVHAAQMSGERTKAYEYAEKLRKHYSKYPLQPDYPNGEMGWYIWRTTRLRFGDFSSILKDTDELPPGITQHPEKWPYAKLLGRYTKAIASLVTHKDIQGAKEHLRYIQTALLPKVDSSFLGIAKVANLTLTSAIEYYSELQQGKEGNLETALQWLTLAKQEQQSWSYTEPPPWFMSVQQCEATLLHKMGRFDEAAFIFRTDLEYNSVYENRFSLWGLLKTLERIPGTDVNVLEQVHHRYEMASKWVDDTKKDDPPMVCPLLGW